MCCFSVTQMCLVLVLTAKRHIFSHDVTCFFICFQIAIICLIFLAEWQVKALRILASWRVGEQEMEADSVDLVLFYGCQVDLFISYYNPTKDSNFKWEQQKWSDATLGTQDNKRINK
jgi:hypothetical protein